MNTISYVRKILKLKNGIRYFNTSTYLQNNIKLWRDKLENAKIEDADFTIKCILGHLLNKEICKINTSKFYNLTLEQQEKFERFCECRMARMPLQYILKEWDFRDLTLKMLPTVFIPRPETEGLVSLILENVNPAQPFRFLEIGCGTGAICLSLLKSLPKSESIALDRSKLACQLTEENARSLGLNDRIKVYNYKVQEKLLLPKYIEGEFHAVISNPPYIKTSDLVHLQPEIKLYENLNALDGGPDGLKVIILLLKLAQEKVIKGGKLWMEVDSEHPQVLEEIVETEYKDTLRYVKTYKDIFGKDRFVEIEKFI